MSTEAVERVLTPPTVGDLVHLDPSDVEVGANVRLDPRLDKDFVASIRERGVLVPVVGYLREEDGRFVVLYGQRRTLAARETGRPSLPAYIVAGQAEADRLVDQMVENDHRAAITTGERVAGFAQLAALGLTANQIAKRTSRKREEVATALVVADSELATKAVDRWDWLTLDQAAGLAEFESDTETVKALAAAAKEGRFEHVLQRARDDREERRLIDEYKAALVEAGITVVDKPDYYDKDTIPVSRLRTDGKGCTVEEHASCPGHAAWVDTEYRWVNAATGEEIPSGYSYAAIDDADDEDYDEDEEPEEEEPAEEVEKARVKKAVAHFVCVNHRSHGHSDSWNTSSTAPKVKAADMTPEEREAASAARRDVIDSNKAWKSAEVVRRQWLLTFLMRKTPPKGTGQFLAQTLWDRYSDRLSSHNLVGVRDMLLGPNMDPSEKMSEPRHLVLVLGHVLAAYEAQTGVHSWRNPSPATTRYLRFLQANGYTLSDVELRACSPE